MDQRRPRPLPPRRRRRRPDWGLVLGCTAVVVPLLLLLGYTIARAHYNERVITCTVVDKDRGQNSGGYRVYTEQCGPLANEDMWFAGKVDSADLHNSIDAGRTYRFRVVGWRFPLLSDLPNILSVESEVSR